MSLFQFLALLEVVHAVVGVTSAPAFHALLQITSRVVLVGVVNTNPASHTADSLVIMLSAWSITEVIRYGYFTLKALGFAPYALTWLRYSLFIALYPIGGNQFAQIARFAPEEPQHDGCVLRSLRRTGDHDRDS